MDRRAAGALLALAACIASSAAAPTVSNQTALDIYDAASEGCYYNFQHYGEGDRIMTNEPCLNCTCHNRMLMCYLRVCPFTKPIGQDCTVEKRADQCCPIVTCPDVPVDLLTSTSTSSPAEYGATGLGKLDKYGCSINGKYFPEGSKVPPTPNKPCEHCYCIRNMTTCVMQECTLHVDGCTPIYHKDVCCPVRYSCDHPEDEMPLLDDMSTTVRPTPGFLLTTTTLSPVTQMTQDCVHNDQIFPDGTSIKTEKACEHCYCMKGDIVCVVQECGTPMENEGKNCTSVAPREGQCCPDTYICEGDEVTTELTIDYTTEPFIEKLTTLVPPRRVLDEGSGYRKEEEPIATELPIIEPEVEGSGEEFATVQPSDGTQKETPSLFDERISSTEDVIGRDTTPQSDIEAEKLTTEPDSELNTVPSGTIEPLGISEPQLTTVSDDIKSSEGTDQTHVDSQHTTASIETKGEEISAQTTEPTFKKEDGSPVPIDITTAKEPEYYSTTEFEPTKTKDEGINTTEQQEPVATVTETKFTTPASSEDGQTETETVIPITTARDELDKEPSFTVHDHTTSETPTMIVTEKSETTTLNAQENEIEDVSTTQGPGRIPGEGDCLQNGITYRNESVVPSMNNCQTDCKCISSIIKCDPIICSDPPEYMSNCVPTYDSLESCCPTYVCDGSKETLPPQPHSQMSEITSSTPTPAFDCEGDQCEIQKADKYPEIVPSDIPQTGDCGSADCKDVLQTPVPMEVQPECTSEDCGGEIQPEPQNKPSTISPVTSESCSGSECQQQPAENEDSLQSCEGENCKTPSIQRCQNEEDCKTDHVPEDKLPCEGESCKLPPESHPVSGTICEGENCKVSPLEPCQNEDECKLVNVPNLELPCEGESCKLEPATETTPAQPSCEGDSCDNKDNQGIECVGEVCKKKITPDVTGELPTQCSDEGCEMSPQTSPVGPICEGDSCKIPPIEPSKVEKPCEGESCKLEPTECNDEGCKTAPETSPIPTCEGENCKISPNEPCQNEDECKLVNVPKLELPCEGESCKLEPATETTPAQPSCEGDSCDNKDDQGIECVGEECKNKITPDVTGELPTQCDGTDCLSEASDSPEKTDVLSTEVPLSTQDKGAETPAVTTEYLDSTKSPEFTNTETPLTSEAMGEGSTDKSVEVTELEPAQTKYSTEYPERKTTEYEVIKETTPVSDLEIQTEGIHELEVMTTPHLAQDISNKEPEISQTTELVTNYPELQESAKPSEGHEVVTEEAKLPEEQEKPEETSETTGKQEKDTLTTVLPETKLETETTEPAIYETPAQFEQETSPESTSEPEISTNLSLDEQYTAVPKLDSEKEATTESNVKSTEHSVLDDKMEVSETETTKDSEETSKAPVEIPVIDEKISTTPSVILDISTEESRSGTPAAPESPTTSSDEPDELYSKTELPDFEKQEPIPQTTSVPEPQTINQEPDKKDDHTTDKLDIEPSTSQASIIFKTDEPDTETPIVDKHKIPDLPSEEVFTESPEINTEEPSYTAHHDEASPQEPIEPESPYIPVYPTISDNLGSDLIDKEVTPGIVPELASSTEKNLYSTASELIPEVQTQEPSVTSLSPKIEDDTKTTPLVDTEQYEHDMRTTEPSVEISPTDTRKYNKDTTESPELITTESPEPISTGAVLTTTYPTTEEKQTESSVYSELTTSKPLQEKEQFTTEPADIFNTEKQEVMPTETPESHVKETESEFKLSTVPEMVTTEKLRPIETEEPQTTSPSVTEPTESQSPSESVEMEKESDENLGKATSESPKQTSEPKYEYSETTPDMIELVEHNEISTLPSSITDERITVSPDTEKSDDNLATETPLLETDFEKVTSTSHPLSEDTEDKIKDETLSTPSDITKDNEAITNPQDVDSHETDDNTTLKPESEDTKPESIPVQVTTTEIIQINKDHSTELPDITSPEQITEQAEGSSTEMSEISDTHTDELTTKQPEVAVTDFRIKPEDELATEEPGSGEMEVKPDKDYLTEKPEIEHVPTSEYESSSLIPEQPSVDIQPVTDKSKDTTPTEVPKIDNEIQPEKENIEPTIPSLSETEKIPGEDIVTVEPEYAVTKAEDLETVQEEFTTENPTIPGIKPEVGSSTEHQLLPDEGVSTGKYDIAVTEKETLEFTTQKPEPELPEIESSSSPAALEDGNGSQSSTAQPESVTLEQSMTTEKEFVTELSETSEPEQETKAPGTKDDIQPDSESLTISPEKEYTTARPKVDLDTTIKTPTISSEPSDVEKEPEHTTDSKLSEPEHKLPSQEIITEQPGPSIDRETVSTIEPTERVTISEVDIVTEEQSSVTKEDKLESSTEKMEEQATISLEPETETTKPDITEEPIMPELGTKEPEISENIIPEHATEPQRQYTTDNLETSSIEHDATSVPILIDRETSAVTEHGSTLEQETGTKEPQEPEEAPSSEQPVHVYETTIKTTNVPFVDSLDDKESSTTKPENIDDSERLSTIAELSSESSTEKEELSEKSTEAPESHGDSNKHDEESNNSTTPGYTMRDETTDLVQETQKPTISEEGLPVHPQPATEKPTDLDLTKDTTAPEEEFLTVTTKATTPKAETETPILSEDLDKTPKPQEPQEETSSAPTSEIPKPGLNEVQATDEVPVPEEEGHFPPSATGGYGQEPDYEDENQPFGPGTCRYGGKVYVSAQQIPRDDPCDFCFCFRSDIICLQQSCPPPIHGCHEEPIQGFCCPRYECPVSMASTLNITTTTTTTTTTLPPHFLPHAYQGAVQRRGCQIKGHTYKVGEVVRASSGPCLHCTCGGDGQMKCDPKACTPEPMLRQMIAAAVSAKRRR